ncbi:Probable trehalose-phosphate phosphatase 4 [Linum perenne]
MSISGMLKRNISKINQAMGLQRSPSNKQKTGQANNNDTPVNTKMSPGAALTRASEDANHTSWLGAHPSALHSFEQMMKAAKGKKIIVFLDYDGTLSPIVDDPNSAFMSEEMRTAVREVAKCFPTAIISGRSIDKVKEFVQLTNVYYAGSHGMDIMAPPRPVKSSDGHYPLLFQPAKRFLPAIQKILKELEEVTGKVKGARVEDNRFCVSVHFRQVKDEVMEIRPTIEWDKGHAVEYFLETLGLSNSDVIPVYIGDDRTDEDAFKVIQRRGTGYPIIVTSCPKETKASHSLVDPSEVLTFLLRLARWRKSSSSSRSLNQIWGVVN